MTKASGGILAPSMVFDSLVIPAISDLDIKWVKFLYFLVHFGVHFFKP